jgi:hypothetical protein
MSESQHPASGLGHRSVASRTRGGIVPGVTVAAMVLEPAVTCRCEPAVFAPTQRRIGPLTALIESPQVCSLKFLTREQRSVSWLAGAGGGAAEGVGGGVVVA